MFVCSLVTVYVDWYGDAMKFGHGGLALCVRAASRSDGVWSVGSVGYGSCCVAIIVRSYSDVWLYGYTIRCSRVNLDRSVYADVQGCTYSCAVVV